VIIANVFLLITNKLNKNQFKLQESIKNGKIQNFEGNSFLKLILWTMSAQSISIVGSIALDTIETHKEFRKNLLGGSATYATIAAGGFSLVYPVGVVGNDFSDHGFELFEKYSASMDDIKISEGNTFRWGGRYDKSMDNRETLFTDLGVFETFSPSLSNTCKNSNYLFLANIHPDIQLSVMAQMNKKSVVIVDSMNLWIETQRQKLLEVIKGCNIFLINESEAQLLSNKKDLEEAGKLFLRLGPDKVIIKKGSKGCDFFSHNNNYTIGTYKVENVRDSTGAGDVFGGGYIAGLASGLNDINSLILGSALASICVEEFGVEGLINMKKDDLMRRQKFISDSFNA